MKPRLKRIALYIVLVAVAAVATWLLMPPASRGHLAAKFDTWQGNHFWLRTIDPKAPKSIFDQLLWDRYHIKVQNAPHYDDVRSISDYVTAYNTVMWTSANQKFGLDVYEACNEELMRK